MRTSIVALAVLLAACSMNYVPRANTPEEVVRYVDRAAKRVAKNGARACEELANSRWMHGDWYVFMLDASGRTVCHPARPQQVGVMAQDLVDPDGNRFGDDFLRVAQGGGGWVEYTWARPGNAGTAKKRSYVRQVTAPDGQVFVIGSGGYEMP